VKSERRDDFIRRILYGQDRGLGASLLRGLLSVGEWVHRRVLETILWTEKVGLRKRFCLPVPVVVIGNITTGGTGKTPMTLFVVRHLQAQGKRVAILSRGHGGSNEATREPRTVSDGKSLLLSPTEAGEEPVLLAEMLPGVPLVVCRDRRKSGVFAVETFSPDILVLDDGFQHWKLHRDLDIVLLDARNPFDNGHLLPRGLLREPPKHLRRAGIILLTRADRVEKTVLSETMAEIKRYAPESALFTATHAPFAWIRVHDGVELPLSELSGQTAVGFAGIADGNAFASTVTELGVALKTFHDFRDHHHYTETELAQLAETGKASGATVAITTEKDRVKAAKLWKHDTLPLYALRIGLRLSDEARFWEEFEHRLVAKEGFTCLQSEKGT